MHPGVHGCAVVIVEGQAAGGAAGEGHGDGGRRQPVGVLQVVAELASHQEPEFRIFWPIKSVAIQIEANHSQEMID